MRLGIFNRRFFVVACIASLSVAFVACDKSSSSSNSNGSDGSGSGAGGEASVIEAKNVLNSGTDIANVKALIFESIPSLSMDWMAWVSNLKGYEVGTSEYKNNGFKITLSSSVPDTYLATYQTRLQNVWDLIGEESDVDVSVSEPNAKITSGVLLVAYNSAGKQIGIITQTAMADKKTYSVSRGYADRDCIIKIKFENTVTYDCSYKKGWNIIYNDISDGSTISQKPSSNMNIIWTFMDTTNF